MATLRDLVPGDLVSRAGMTALFVEQAPHPLYPGLRLVIWRLAGGVGGWSHDALSAGEDVGTVAPADHLERQRRLRYALLGPQ